jgi:hypothetical protein
MDAGFSILLIALRICREVKCFGLAFARRIRIPSDVVPTIWYPRPNFVPDFLDGKVYLTLATFLFLLTGRNDLIAFIGAFFRESKASRYSIRY